MTWEYRVVKKTEQYMYDLSEMTYDVDEYVEEKIFPKTINTQNIYDDYY